MHARSHNFICVAIHKANQTSAELAQTRSYNESLRSDISKLNAVVVAEKALAQKQSAELSRWQSDVQTLQSNEQHYRTESDRANLLQSANVELNDELQKTRHEGNSALNDLQKSLASMNSQLESTILEKNEVSGAETEQALRTHALLPR